MRGLAQEPEPTHPVYPDHTETTVGESSFDRHLYVDAGGRFSFKSTTWEEKTLEEELARNDVIGWLRNPDRKAWSVCVPYEMGGGYKGCYPDFLVVRKAGGHLVVDIVDPHLLTMEDAWYRATGLAQYAARHADRFGCVRRRKRTTHFGIGGPVISAETDHPFRPKWTTLRLTAGRG